jgi:hypothetical protein
MLRTLSEKSIFKLIKDLSNQTKTLIREEVQLVKTEVKEKISQAGRNTAYLGVGALIAYAGVIVLFISLGMVIAFAFHQAGTHWALSVFFGQLAMGILTIILGGCVVLKAIRFFSKESITPQKSLDALKLKPRTSREHTKSPSKKESEDIQEDVFDTQDEISDTTSEIKHRLSPSRVRSRLEENVKEHPFRWNTIAMIIGALGAFTLRHRLKMTRT